MMGNLGAQMGGGSGIQVRLQPRNSLAPSSLNLNANSQKDGSFEFASVPPGSYYLIASVPRNGRGGTVKLPLEVGNSNIEGINLAINPGPAVAGHVRFEGDPPAAPPALNVRLSFREPVPGSQAPQPAKVAADGSFRFDEISPDRYNVNVNAPQGYYVKSIQAGQVDALVAGYDAGTSGGSLEIVLGANPPVVSGSVVNPDGQQPAPAVTVVLVPQAKERKEVGYFYFTTTTDQTGNFSFPRVAPGDYKAFAWEDVQDGQWWDPEFIKIHEARGESVSAKENNPVTVRLTMIPAK
jgi:hypothetical protein